MPEMIKKDGGVTFFDARGPLDSTPVVLIEGLGAHLHGWRDGFCQSLLDEGFRVIRFDNRDVGLSQHYPDQTYGLGDMADDVHELIEHLGAGPVHIVGQSLGGMLAQHLVTRHPHDVASMALLYTATSARHLAGSDRGVETLQAVRHASSRDEAIEVHIEQERTCASRSYSFDEAWKRELGGLMWDRCYDPDGVVRQARALFGDTMDLAGIAAVAVPTLLIHGTSDRLIAETGSIELHELIRDSELWLVDGMGHDLPRELWPEITDRILANIQRARVL